MHMGQVGHNPTRLPIHPWMGADGVARRRRCCWDRAVELVIGIEGLVSVVDEGFAHLSVAIMRCSQGFLALRKASVILPPLCARACHRGFVLIFFPRIRPHIFRGFVLILFEDSSSFFPRIRPHFFP